MRKVFGTKIAKLINLGMFLWLTQTSSTLSWFPSPVHCHPRIPPNRRLVHISPPPRFLEGKSDGKPIFAFYWHLVSFFLIRLDLITLYLHVSEPLFVQVTYRREKSLN